MTERQTGKAPLGLRQLGRGDRGRGKRLGWGDVTGDRTAGGTDTLS